MRGKDDRSEILFSYIRLDERIPADHPLRVIRQLVDAALAELSRAFAKLYARDGRPFQAADRITKARFEQEEQDWLSLAEKAEKAEQAQACVHRAALPQTGND